MPTFGLRERKINTLHAFWRRVAEVGLGNATPAGLLPSSIHLVGLHIGCGRCTASALHTFSRPASRRACSRLDDIEPLRFDSFTYACDVSGILALTRGLTPEAPFLDRNYPASSVVRASPPPWRPGLPLTGFRLTRAHHRQGFPCCVLFPLPCMPAPIPRRERSVPLSLSSRPPSVFPFSTQGRLPHCPFRGLLGVHSHSGLHVR